MNQLLTAVISGVLTGGGAVGLLQFLIARRDRRREQDGAQIKALRYLMLYIIQERAKELLAAGAVTLDEKRSLRLWHELYHQGLGGNGDAAALMAQVDRLPMSVK